ncbi:MAG: hypothetical protein QME90_06465 [Thermodesulfobacteriota bacterium]|nr:hypothetical protein [Thermodesulfobacteriota bacterium]
MKATIKKIVEQVEALPESELDEFLSWLAEYETSHSDEWDKEIEQDSQNGGTSESRVEASPCGYSRRKDQAA